VRGSPNALLPARFKESVHARCRGSRPFAVRRAVDLRAATLVLVVPVYWCAPPGLFKDFIDRTVVAFGTDPMKGKSVHLVSVAQSAGFDPHERMLAAWVRWHGGPPLKSMLRLIAFQRGDLPRNASAVRKLRKLGLSRRPAASSSGRA
jgi:hypothetical protein